ncbi:MAG: histidine kinase [Edafosvirus sp.]|uniref:histidine kinase n=1 Tax=Edafosvirus sp. TaxID=2487765 RepID=A0A3G4ZXL8_9VIRU|nr:MAG: histidine kinase [Edafosvirus sp.]
MFLRDTNNKILFVFTLLIIFIGEIIGIYYSNKILIENDQKLINLKMDTIVNDVLRQTTGRIKQIQYTILRPTAFFREVGKNVTKTTYYDNMQMDKNPLLTSIDTIFWVPKIYYNEKIGYETFRRNNDDPTFIIKELNTTGRLIPVEQRDFYFPYAYSAPPLASLDNVLNGFDFLSTPLTKNFINMALVSINSTGTYRVSLIKKTNPYSFGIILNQLSFPNIVNMSVDNIIGIMMGIINIGDIISISIENVDIKINRNDIDVTVFDITDDIFVQSKQFNISLLYKEIKNDYKNVWFPEDLPNYEYSYNNTISVANRLWNINLRFLDNFIIENSTSISNYIIISMSIASILFNILYIILYRMYYLSKHKENIEREKKLIANKMLGYVNHEIRNPLNVINGMVDITIETLNNKIEKNTGGTNVQIQKDELSSVISDLYTAEGSCNMLRHIVNDVLDIRKLEDDKLVIDNEYINLDLFCKSIHKTIIPKLREKIDVSFSMEFKDNLENENIYIDKNRLSQILLNLIFNSIKFTIVGNIILKIRKNNSNIIFEVNDTGRGIPDEAKSYIFQPFHQADKEDSSRYGGIGLGLYLCNMLVNCMGGTINFESKFGIGSSFWIEVPLNIKNKQNNTTHSINMIEMADQKKLIQ